MSQGPSVEQRITAFLEGEAPSQAADRVLTATFDRTRSTRQVGARRWRFPAMGPIPASLTAAAAAFVLIAGAGTVLLVTRPVGPQPGISDIANGCAARESTVPPEATEAPLGVAIVCLDGTVALDLGLPRDAWMPDLSWDGARLVFRTAGSVGVCEDCLAGPHPAIVDVGSTQGAFLDAPVVEGTGIELDPRTIAMTAWSPDGRRIAYQAEIAGNLDVFVTDLGTDDGTPATPGRTMRLTTDPAIDEFPAWTPDGSTIVYANSGGEPLDESGFSPTQEIWRVPASGGVPIRLTDDDLPDTQPDVGADGRIVYWRDGTIWQMNVDGDGQARLGIDAGDAVFGPRLSPSGSKLALLRFDPSARTTSNPATGEVASLPLLKVIVADLSTGQVIDIGPRVATDLNPVSWTPDGVGLLINRYDDGG